MNQISNIQLSQHDVENRIFTFRGMQVMIDRDLAEMYEVETKVLNQAVKRNVERFPKEFRFQLTEEEANICSRSQIVTLNINANKRNQLLQKMQQLQPVPICVWFKKHYNNY